MRRALAADAAGTNLSYLASLSGLPSHTLTPAASADKPGKESPRTSPSHESLSHCLDDCHRAWFS